MGAHREWKEDHDINHILASFVRTVVAFSHVHMYSMNRKCPYAFQPGSDSLDMRPW